MLAYIKLFGKRSYVQAAYSVDAVFIGVLVTRQNSLSDTLGRGTTSTSLGGFADLGVDPLVAIAPLDDVSADRSEVSALLAAFTTILGGGGHLVGGDSRFIGLVVDLTVEGRDGTVRRRVCGTDDPDVADFDVDPVVVDAALDGVAAEKDDWEDGALLVAVTTVSGDGRCGEVVGNTSDSDSGGDPDEAHEGKEEDREELHGEPVVCRSRKAVDKVV